MNENSKIGPNASLIEEARERLRELDTASVIAGCLFYLQRPENDGIEWYKRIPFISLLIIKWAAELWEPDSKRRLPEDGDFDYIHQKLWDANGELASPLPLSIGLRRIAFQQFWYQRRFDLGSLPRQALIFGELMNESTVLNEFTQEFKIEAKDFIRQLAHIGSQIGVLLDLEYLRVLKPVTRPEDAEHFPIVREFLIARLADLHEYAVRLSGYGTPRHVELCEQSPLIRTPFIRTAKGDECIHHKVLFRSLETSLYDILRSRGPEIFMREFGPAFEKYVDRVLGELEGVVIREADLQAMLPGEGKCVDFAMVDDDLLLLIDTKGIEGHYDELYHNLPEILTAKLRTTALHAIDQAVDTVRRLPDHMRRPLTIFLCVTYKHLNIGDGSALRDLTVGTPEWDAPRWHDASLPPSHMFTVSISELERLCGVVRAGLPAVEVLGKILSDNGAPDTRKLLFEQHLMHLGPVDIPQCSWEAAHKLCGMEYPL